MRSGNDFNVGLVILFMLVSSVSIGGLIVSLGNWWQKRRKRG